MLRITAKQHKIIIAVILSVLFGGIFGCCIWPCCSKAVALSVGPLRHLCCCGLLPVQYAIAVAVPDSRYNCFWNSVDFAFPLGSGSVSAVLFSSKDKWEELPMTFWEGDVEGLQTSLTFLDASLLYLEGSELLPLHFYKCQQSPPPPPPPFLVFYYPC